MLELIYLFIIALTIFYYVVLWKFAVKADRKGYELYIPIYSDYVLLSIAGMDVYWFIMCIIAGMSISIFSEYSFMVILSFIFLLILSFIYCIKLANKFNKGIGFAFGLFFLNPIFMTILALDNKCVYNK